MKGTKFKIDFLCIVAGHTTVDKTISFGRWNHLKLLLKCAKQYQKHILKNLTNSQCPIISHISWQSHHFASHWIPQLPSILLTWRKARPAARWSSVDVHPWWSFLFNAPWSMKLLAVFIPMIHLRSSTYIIVIIAIMNVVPMMAVIL